MKIAVIQTYPYRSGYFYVGAFLVAARGLVVMTVMCTVTRNYSAYWRTEVNGQLLRHHAVSLQQYGFLVYISFHV